MESFSERIMNQKPVKIPVPLWNELHKEAKAYGKNIPLARYMRAILLHRKLMDTGNPEFVKSLFNRK